MQTNMQTRQMTIGKKLTLTSGALIAVVVGLSAVAWIGIGNLKRAVDSAYLFDAKKLELSGRIEAFATSMRGADRAILLAAF